MNQTPSQPGPALVLGVGANLEVVPEVGLGGSWGLNCFRIVWEAVGVLGVGGRVFGFLFCLLFSPPSCV